MVMLLYLLHGVHTYLYYLLLYIFPAYFTSRTGCLFTMLLQCFSDISRAHRELLYYSTLYPTLPHRCCRYCKYSRLYTSTPDFLQGILFFSANGLSIPFFIPLLQLLQLYV